MKVHTVCKITQYVQKCTLCVKFCVCYQKIFHSKIFILISGMWHTMCSSHTVQSLLFAQNSMNYFSEISHSFSPQKNSHFYLSQKISGLCLRSAALVAVNRDKSKHLKTPPKHLKMTGETPEVRSDKRKQQWQK